MNVKQRKSIRVEVVMQVNKTMGSWEPKYRKKGLVNQQVAFSVLRHFLIEKKPEYSYADISHLVKRNTWESKLKREIKGEGKSELKGWNVIRGERRGEFRFSFDERLFKMWLFEQFISWLAAETVNFYHKTKRLNKVIKRCESRGIKLGDYVSSHIGKENSLSDEGERTIIRSGKKNRELGAEITNGLHKIFYLRVPNNVEIKDQGNFSHLARSWNKYGSRRRFVVDFVKKIHQKDGSQTTVLIPHKGSPRSVRNEVKKRLLDLVNSSYPVVFKKFEQDFTKRVEWSNQSFCDVFETIAESWAEEYRELIDHGTKSYLNQYAADLELFLCQLCYLTRHKHY